MPNLVKLKGKGERRELIASVAITPGMLVNLASATTVRPHNVAGATAQAAFAVEREMTGDNIDIVYAISDTVIYEIMQRGAVVNALLAANAAAVVVGDMMESAGNGALRKVIPPGTYQVAPVAPPVAIALETINNSANGSMVRIQVEVL